MMGIAGAYLTMAKFNAFTWRRSGRGWSPSPRRLRPVEPWRCAAGAFLFAALEALQLRLQATNILHVPIRCLMMLVLTIVAMALVRGTRGAGRSRPSAR